MSTYFDITETTESREQNYATPGQKTTYARRFYAAIKPANAEVGLNDSYVINDLFDDYAVAIRQPLDTGSPLICRSIEVRPIAGSRHFDLVANYETFANVDPTSGLFVPNPPFVRVQSNSAVRNLDLYRYGVSIPALGAATPGVTTDIGGTSVDQQGRPIVVPRAQIEIQIDTLYDTTTKFDSLAPFTDYLLKRNSDTFMNFAAGTLLFASYVISEVGPEWYMITYRLLYDQDYHLVQIPKLDINGRTQLTGSSGVGQATTVFFYQPYQSTFAFNTAGNLFTTEELAYINR